MENMETLRQILENLITLSFDQEELINNISSILPKIVITLLNILRNRKKYQTILKS